MKDFMEVLAGYDEKIQPLTVEKERINSQINVWSDPELGRDLDIKFKVFERRLEEAIVDGDEEKEKLLQGEFNEVTRKIFEKEKVLNKDIPLLRAELQRLDNEMLSIGSSLEKEAIPVVREQWFQKLNEALDFVEHGSLALGEFRRRVGITGFSPDHHFQINLAGAFELAQRLKKWIPRL